MAGATMDDQRCVWCGEWVEPEWQGAMVIDEDARGYQGERYTAYFDRTQRVIPRRYGHTPGLLTSIEGFRRQRAWEDERLKEDA
jgi:hypothetical protein